MSTCDKERFWRAANVAAATPLGGAFAVCSAVACVFIVLKLWWDLNYMLLESGWLASFVQGKHDLGEAAVAWTGIQALAAIAFVVFVFLCLASIQDYTAQMAKFDAERQKKIQ